MGGENTPPASPREEINEMLEDNDDEELLEEGAVEVIDLDEELEGMGWDQEDQDDPIPEEGNSSLILTHHKKSVFCVSVQQQRGDTSDVDDNLKVATGGEDDCCYLWDLKTGAVSHKWDNFKDSVTQVRFNSDGSLLAMADMSGLIQVVKVLPNLNAEPLWSFETSDLTWLDWHPSINVLFAGTDDSSFWMWKIPSGQSKIYQGHGEKVELAKILHDGKRVVVGYADGSLRIFDLKSEEVIHNVAPFQSKAAVCSLDVRTDNQLVVAGSADGEVAILNANTGKILACFTLKSPQPSAAAAPSDEGEHASSVEAVLFNAPELNQVIAGDINGNVTVWDLASQVAKVSTRVATGVVKMCWKSPTELIIGTLDGDVCIMDPRSLQSLASCTGHSDQVLDFALTKKGSLLVSASDDKTCRVYNLEEIMNTATSS